MGDFLDSLFGGRNKSLDADINNSAGVRDFSTGIGEGDVSKASKYYGDILSGDPTASARAIEPEATAAKAQAQNAKLTTANFGNRGGGTNATSATIDDSVRGKLMTLLNSARGNAATNLSGIGTTEQGIGLQAGNQNAQQSQQRMMNWLNSILGKGITSAAGTLESFGLGKLGGGGGFNPPTPSATPAPVNASASAPAGASPADSDPFAAGFDSTGITPYYG